MDAALRNRLTYGPIMGAAILLLLWLDHAAEGWTRGWIVAAGRDFGVGGIGLLILLLLILPPATYELARLFSARQLQPYRFIAAVGSWTLVTHAFLMQFPRLSEYGTSSLAFIIVAVMLFAALRRAWMRQTHEAISAMAGTVLATMYLGGLAWFLMALRVKHSSLPAPQGFHGSVPVILMMLLVVKSADIGAYFGGRLFGRHKLIPWLSPKKTWEGLVCGLALSGVVGAVCAPFVSHLHWERALVLGVLIGVAGQLGDLLESMMKRDAEVKDSSGLIPGFGGVLDVIDSPLLAAPFAYLVFSIF